MAVNAASECESPWRCCASPLILKMRGVLSDPDAPDSDRYGSVSKRQLPELVRRVTRFPRWWKRADEKTTTYPQNTGCSLNDVSMVGQRRRRWANIETALSEGPCLLGIDHFEPCKCYTHYFTIFLPYFYPDIAIMWDGQAAGTVRKKHLGAKIPDKKHIIWAG